ncbi:radical SAM protein [Streptomyces sp. NBC_00090]|uniref:coproporphyrinogen-III oxidase family protein n=1 Tax=Streptomyces sp. NBC_00090 TaxID=2903619 RepID=UPI003256076F
MTTHVENPFMLGLDSNFYLKDEFESPEKRTNVTWFYPKICGFQDALDDEAKKAEYFSFLDRQSHPEQTDILLYFHIPFCEAFCNFCACFKESAAKYQGERQKRFVRAMVKEIERNARSKYFQGTKVKYVQFGGGTPSALEQESMADILEAVHREFDLSEVDGISLEGSPLGLSKDGYIEMLKSLGITRISFGVQTLDEEIRRKLTIKATVEQVHQTAENIRKAGIRTFALDLMYNLPGQDDEVLARDLEGICAELRPSFVQTYRFNQWEGTRLDQQIRAGKVADVKPSGSIERVQYRQIKDGLAAYGYDKQLLINFFTHLDDPGEIGLNHACGGNGYRASYTLGIGPAAENYMGERSYRNHTDVERWMRDVEAGVLPIEQGRICSEDEVENRVMVFFPVFGTVRKEDVANFEKYRREVDWLVEGGYAVETDEELTLTEVGRENAGNIAFLFYSDEEKARARRTMYLSLKNKRNPFHQDQQNIPRTPLFLQTRPKTADEAPKTQDETPAAPERS